MQQTVFLSTSETASACCTLYSLGFSKVVCAETISLSQSAGPVCISFLIPPIAQKEGRAKEDISSYQGRSSSSLSGWYRRCIGIASLSEARSQLEHVQLATSPLYVSCHYSVQSEQYRDK